MSASDDLKKYLHELNEVEKTLTPWIESRKPTLFWKIRQRLSDEAKKAVEGQKVASQRLQAITLPTPSTIHEIRKTFTSAIRNVTLMLIAIVGTYFLIRYYNQDARAWLDRNDFGPSRIVTWAISFYLTFYISALLVYYRSWSSYYKKVRIANNEVVAHIEELAHLKDESQRLASVHEQANSWYRLLSLTLLEPWEIAPRWHSDPSEKLNVDQIPLAVRFGQAHAGGRAIQTILERTTLESVLRKGWRTEALNLLIEESALDLGLDPQGFNIRTLDSDLPEASNGGRKAFALQLGKNVRESAGSRKVRQISRYVRESIIPKLATPVRSMHADALENLDWTYGGAEDDNWSGFYSEIYGKGPKKAPAFSTQPLTAEGMSKAIHTVFDSYALMPVNTTVDEEGVQIIPIDPESPRWIELSVRVDLAGPHPASSFKIVRSDGAEPGAPTAPPIQQESKPVENLEWNVSFDTSEDGKFN
ncbi:MAG: hypothetical protein RJA33_1380 [Actinomycetota bacterium]|jgi:hypothetical protein